MCRPLFDRILEISWKNTLIKITIILIYFSEKIWSNFKLTNSQLSLSNESSSSAAVTQYEWLLNEYIWKQSA